MALHDVLQSKQTRCYESASFWNVFIVVVVSGATHFLPFLGHITRQYLPVLLHLGGAM